MERNCRSISRQGRLVLAVLTGSALLLATTTLVRATSMARTEPQATTTDYILWYRNFDSPPVRALVRLALEETPEYGPFTISRSIVMGQGRALRELADHHTRVVTLANVATTQQREDELLAIPIPIDGGLLGFRVCVIKKENQDRFRNIKSLDDLIDQGIRIGQGQHWPDTPILRGNGVDVITNTRFETLFKMLKGDRFDCFARGVNEVLFDLADIEDKDLMIEPSLLLAYPMPSYFFVAPGDQQTAIRIQLGMERAIRDGRFARYLARYYLKAVVQLNLEHRTVLVLANPFLTDDSRAIGRQALSTLQQRIGGNR